MQHFGAVATEALRVRARDVGDVLGAHVGAKWPAAGFMDTKFRCFMKSEVANAKKTIWDRVQD